MSSKTKHMYAIELTTEEHFKLGEILYKLKNAMLIPDNTNLGMFMKEAFYRGVDDYQEDLNNLK
jgi:hypothetical protein